ncbi:MAG: HlyC/CorC family transporter [Clostridia bacterium]|nr:HlyC/CorC family transporter [Clostridia bacterium]
MGESSTKIVLIVCLLLFSAFFSATEMAFSSLNKIRLKNAAENGDKKAADVLKVIDGFDRVLYTVLVGNNIVNILSSSVATVLFIDLLQNSAKGTTMATVVMTVLVLIFGECVPKSLAKEKPERFAMAVLPLIKFFRVILWLPATLLLGIKRLIALCFKRGESEEAAQITEDEIITFVEEAELEGSIGEQESELIRSAVEFNDREAQEILTHRVDISAISEDAGEEEIEALFIETGFSRLPVYRDTIDNIIGVIHHKDFFNKVKTGMVTLSSVIKPVVSVHKSIKISDLLKMLQKEKTHIAVVADDYGGTLGIVTMEDIIEELVGDIWDEHDEVVEEIVELEENRYRVLCTASLDKVFEMFDIRMESDEASVGGWVMKELDKIPEEGDAFTYDNVEVVVTKTDSKRLVEIEATVHVRVDGEVVDMPEETEEEQESEKE